MTTRDKIGARGVALVGRCVALFGASDGWAETKDLYSPDSSVSFASDSSSTDAIFRNPSTGLPRRLIASSVVLSATVIEAGGGIPDRISIAVIDR